LVPQVLLPLLDQTFKNHCLYFLSSPSKNLSSCGYASNKEKEMVTRYLPLFRVTVCIKTSQKPQIMGPKKECLGGEYRFRNTEEGVGVRVRTPDWLPRVLPRCYWL